MQSEDVDKILGVVKAITYVLDICVSLRTTVLDPIKQARGGMSDWAMVVVNASLK